MHGIPIQIDVPRGEPESVSDSLDPARTPYSLLAPRVTSYSRSRSDEVLPSYPNGNEYRCADPTLSSTPTGAATDGHSDLSTFLRTPNDRLVGVAQREEFVHRLEVARTTLGYWSKLMAYLKGLHDEVEERYHGLEAEADHIQRLLARL